MDINTVGVRQEATLFQPLENVSDFGSLVVKTTYEAGLDTRIRIYLSIHVLYGGVFLGRSKMVGGVVLSTWCNTPNVQVVSTARPKTFCVNENSLSIW